MDDHVALGQRVVHRRLDRIRGRVALADRGAGRDADDDVRELPAAGLAHPQAAKLHRGLERADRPRGDRVRLGRNPVHQHVDVSAHQPRSRGEHEHGDKERGGGVGFLPPGANAEQPAEHRNRTGEVACEVNSVCLQRGRAIAPADAQRHQHPAEVDADHDRESKQRVPLRVHRSRRQPGQVRDGPPADEDGGDDEDRGLGQRRQMLRLPVTIGVAGIGGAPRDADREEREERRDEVDAGVRRLRE